MAGVSVNASDAVLAGVAVERVVGVDVTDGTGGVIVDLGIAVSAGGIRVAVG